MIKGPELTDLSNPSQLLEEIKEESSIPKPKWSLPSQPESIQSQNIITTIVPHPDYNYIFKLIEEPNSDIVKLEVLNRKNKPVQFIDPFYKLAKYETIDKDGVNKWVRRTTKFTTEDILKLLHQPNVNIQELITIPDFPYLFKLNGDNFQIFKLVSGNLIEH